MNENMGDGIRQETFAYTRDGVPCERYVFTFGVPCWRERLDRVAALVCIGPLIAGVVVYKVGKILKQSGINRALAWRGLKETLTWSR